MRMALVKYIFLAILLLSLLTDSAQSSSDSNHSHSYVQDACSVTQYTELCICALSPYSNIAKRSSTMWASAGVSVTINETKSVVQYLRKLKSFHSFSGRNAIALSDCIECLGNGINELHRSLGLLRRLTKNAFDAQLSDLITWISAALTDGETCIDGFDEEQKGNNNNQIKSLRNRVVNVTYVTSNALALANKLASTGLEDVRNL